MIGQLLSPREVRYGSWTQTGIAPVRRRRCEWALDGDKVLIRIESPRDALQASA